MIAWEEWKNIFWRAFWLYARVVILATLFSVVIIIAAEAIDPGLADSIVAKTRILHKAIFGVRGMAA